MTSLAAMLDALDEPAKPVLDPRVYVEPKDRGTASEIVRQAEAVAHLRKYAKRMVVFAVPNSARASGEKLRQHREGAIYGAADLVLAWAGGVAFVEMKNGTSMPRRNQVEFLNGLAGRDHCVAVCRTAEGLARWLHGVGAPVPNIKQLAPEATGIAPGPSSPVRRRHCGQ